MFVRIFAVLDACHAVIKFFEDGAAFFTEGIDLVAGIDLGDGSNDHGSTAGTDFRKIAQFITVDGTAFHFHTKIFGDLLEGFIGDTSQNGGGVGSGISTFFGNTEEVACAEFINIFVGFGIHEKGYGIPFFLGFFLGFQTCGIVSAQLDGTGSQGGCTVIIINGDGGNAFETGFVVCADRHDHNDHLVTCAGGNPDLGICTDIKGTDVERAAASVRGNIVDIVQDDFAAHFHKKIHRHFRAEDTGCGKIDALCIFIGSENADGTIFAAEGFETFKCSLTVMEAGGGNGKGHIVIGFQFGCTPCSVFIGACDVGTHRHIAETQCAPVDVCSDVGKLFFCCHFFLQILRENPFLLKITDFSLNLLAFPATVNLITIDFFRKVSIFIVNKFFFTPKKGILKMKWTKLMLLAVSSAALAVLTASCSYFNNDETAKPYLKRGTAPKANAAKNGQAMDQAANGEANLLGGETGKAANKDEELARMEKPGEYKEGSNAAGNDYDGFGTPVPGIVFEPVYFKFDQSIVDPDEAGKVDAVVKYLKDNPGTGVVIEGNCDNRGTAEYNRALGERRALAAQEMMVGSGIDAARIKTLSYGEEKSAAKDNDETAHAQERRDEFVIVKLSPAKTAASAPASEQNGKTAEEK